MRRPGIGTGAALGGLLAAPLAATFYLAWRLAGAPFPPFDLFDFLARALPGPVVTFGIDALVDVLSLVAPGAVADLAKPAEQALAVALFLILMAVAGGGVFAVGAAGDDAPDRPATFAAWLGAALALGAAALAWDPAAVGASLAGLAWLLAAFVGWGRALAWAWWRLTAAEAEAEARAGAAAEATRLDRRRFLIRLGGASAVLTAVGAGVGALLPSREQPPERMLAGPDAEPEPWSARNRLPNAGADLAPAPGTRPELTPLEDHYRIDINTISPAVDEASWRMRVDGLVTEPREFTLDEIRAYPAMDRFITLSCISNRIAGGLISTQRWTGVSLQRLLPDLALDDAATHLRIRSVDGFYEIVSLETIRADERVMLAYAWDGLPLRREHGFPLRIYIPDVYGMKQPKWIDSIEAIAEWEPGYWVERGWSATARMHATSVIDTVATDALVRRDGGTLVPIGGIAHAGARGISSVEVSVDGGPWERARLRQPLSDLTWVLWRYDWPFEEGSHTFAVRCTDGDGVLQPLERTSPRPDGATGVHEVRERVTSTESV